MSSRASNLGSWLRFCGDREGSRKFGCGRGDRVDMKSAISMCAGLSRSSDNGIMFSLDVNDKIPVSKF